MPLLLCVAKLMPNRAGRGHAAADPASERPVPGLARGAGCQELSGSGQALPGKLNTQGVRLLFPAAQPKFLELGMQRRPGNPQQACGLALIATGSAEGFHQ